MHAVCTARACRHLAAGRLFVGCFWHAKMRKKTTDENEDEEDERNEKEEEEMKTNKKKMTLKDKLFKYVHLAFRCGTVFTR